MKNIKIKYNAVTGSVKLYSNGGTLWTNWLEASNIDRREVKSIRVAEGTVFLPEDSNHCFSELDELKTLDLNGFDTSRVKNMSAMFSGCRALTELDLSGFDTKNVTDMSFAGVGFNIDGSGNTIVQDTKVVNSWSATLADVFQSVNIINDVNAIASQFSGDFTITIPGSVKQYSIAQPISLLIMSGNTISPVTGIYNVISVSHSITNMFITTIKVQRLVMSNANEVAASQGITLANQSGYSAYSYTPTKNVISAYKVDFGDIYPTFLDISA